MLDRISLLQLLHRLADQGRAFPVGPGEAAEGAPPDVIDIGIIERGRIGREVGREFAVDPQEDVIAGDLRPGRGQCAHIRLAVHVRAVEDEGDGPPLRVARLVALGGPDGIGQQAVGRAVDDLAGGQGGVLDVLRGLAPLPAVPAGHPVGPARPGEVGPLRVEVETAGAGPEGLDPEVEVPPLDVAVQARRPPESVASLHLRAVPGQFHQAEVGEPEARDFLGLARGGRGVGPPAVPGALVAVAGAEPPVEGVPRRINFPVRVDVNLSLVVLEGQPLGVDLPLERELVEDDLPRDVLALLLERDGAEGRLPFAGKPAGLVGPRGGPSDEDRRHPHDDPDHSRFPPGEMRSRNPDRGRRVAASAISPRPGRPSTIPSGRGRPAYLIIRVCPRQAHFTRKIPESREASRGVNLQTSRSGSVASPNLPGRTSILSIMER